MKELQLMGGSTIDESLAYLKKKAEEYGEVTTGIFNGVSIYSIDDTDDAYMRVIEKKKSEYEAYVKQLRIIYDREQEEFNKRIPELTKKYRSEARGLVLEDMLDKWDEIVPVRLSDIYRGLELQLTLGCCKIMRDESLVFAARLEKAYDLFMEYGHSGASAYLTIEMLRRFCPNGNELAEAISDFRFTKAREA